MLKGPVIHGVEWIGDKIKEGMTDLVVDYVSTFPILIGVSIAVYALISMFSKKLASLGVVGVFVYGALVIIA